VWVIPRLTIPAVLLIDGHNPLILLHDLLSEGIHQLSDDECLERAQQAEIILCEIADRMQTALTERKNVKAAITSIMTRKRGTGGSDRA
jgi:aminoglycoside/choline kinase family phosphotransferase